MTPELSVGIVGAIAVFARVGGCIMLLPAFGGAAVPAQVRILMVLAISLPLVGVPAETASVADWRGVAAIVGAELLTGFALGMLVRLFYLAIAFAGEIVASSIGLAGMPGISMEAGAQENVVSALVNWTALVSFLILDLHHPVLRALAASYGTIELGSVLDARVLLVRVVDTLGVSFVLAAQIASPFIAYALIANFVAGLMNKLVPQIPTYFVSMPATIAGGLLLLLVTIAHMTGLFEAGLSDFVGGLLD